MQSGVLKVPDLYVNRIKKETPFGVSFFTIKIPALR